MNNRECVINVSRMKLAPPGLKSIKAFFVLTINSVRLRNWKLTESTKNGVFRVSSPTKEFVNKKSKFQHEPLVQILDPKIIDTVLKLALNEYRIQKEMINDNQSSR